MSSTIQNWNFSSWLPAPFLKGLSGQQLFEMMRAIKDTEASGVMECAIENGAVVMLYFKDGRPLDEKEKVSDIIGKSSVVVAWMPQKAEHIDEKTSPELHLDLESEDAPGISDQVHIMFQGYPVFSKGDQWIVLLQESDIIATSHDALDFVGGGMVTGLVAQVNGAFHDVFHDVVLERFTLDCDGVRFGFSALGNGWTALYRADAIYQHDVNSCLDDLEEIVASVAEQSDFVPRSRAVSVSRTDYGFVRPHFYRRADRLLRKELTGLELPWDAIWFQYQDKVVYHMPLEGDGQQEIDGPIEQLFTLIRRAFEPLSGRGASNLVLHAPGSTVWCDFQSEGFWATRFDTEKIAYRRVSEDAARRGLQAIEHAFQAPN